MTTTNDYYVLVVEDDSALQHMYQLKLQKEGYRVSVASNGVEGMDRLKEAIPDIILLDILMPIKDGLTLLREIRTIAEFRYIPVVMLTNVSEPEYKDTATHLGIDDYIVKGETDPGSVIKKIRIILDGKTAQ